MNGWWRHGRWGHGWWVHGRQQAGEHFGHHPVGHGEAEAALDGLDLVDLHHDHRRRVPAHPERTDDRGEVLIEAAPIGQARHGVVRGEVFQQRRLGAHPAHVAKDRNPPAAGLDHRHLEGLRRIACKVDLGELDGRPAQHRGHGRVQREVEHALARGSDDAIAAEHRRRPVGLHEHRVGAVALHQEQRVAQRLHGGAELLLGTRCLCERLVEVGDVGRGEQRALAAVGQPELASGEHQAHLAPVDAAQEADGVVERTAFGRQALQVVVGQQRTVGGVHLVVEVVDVPTEQLGGRRHPHHRRRRRVGREELALGPEHHHTLRQAVEHRRELVAHGRGLARDELGLGAVERHCEQTVAHSAGLHFEEDRGAVGEVRVEVVERERVHRPVAVVPGISVQDEALPRGVVEHLARQLPDVALAVRVELLRHTVGEHDLGVDEHAVLVEDRPMQVHGLREQVGDEAEALLGDRHAALEGAIEHHLHDAVAHPGGGHLVDDAALDRVELLGDLVALDRQAAPGLRCRFVGELRQHEVLRCTHTRRALPHGLQVAGTIGIGEHEIDHAVAVEHWYVHEHRLGKALHDEAPVGLGCLRCSQRQHLLGSIERGDQQPIAHASDGDLLVRVTGAVEQVDDAAHGPPLDPELRKGIAAELDEHVDLLGGQRTDEVAAFVLACDGVRVVDSEVGHQPIAVVHG